MKDKDFFYWLGCLIGLCPSIGLVLLFAYNIAHICEVQTYWQNKTATQRMIVEEYCREYDTGYSPAETIWRYDHMAGLLEQELATNPSR